MPQPEARASSQEPEFLNVREEMARRRSRLGRTIDGVGRSLATPTAFALLLAFHLGWVVLNLPGLAPGVEPWDPPPFTLLATIASALAPFLSVMILMAQYRDARITELREEIALQLALRTDRQLTVVLCALDDGVRRAVDVQEHELAQLRAPVHPEQLLTRVRKHLEQTEGRTLGERDEDDQEQQDGDGDGDRDRDGAKPAEDRDGGDGDGAKPA